MNFIKTYVYSAVLTLMLLFTIPAAAHATGAVHTVSRGESLHLISQWYNTPLSAIKSANNLKSNYIQPGQRLWIPQQQYQSTSTSTYNVRYGDSLFNIAKRFGITAQQLKQINGLYTNTIYPGQTLSVPVGQATVTPAREQHFSRLSQQDIDMLARLVYSEARGEPYTGQVAVASVALNRLESSKFPNTISGVVFEPWAFTAVHDGQYWLTPDSTAYKAAQDAANGWDPTNGALYYWNPATANNRWIWSRPITNAIGKHVFAI